MMSGSQGDDVPRRGITYYATRWEVLDASESFISPWPAETVREEQAQGR